jgi:Fe2+ transport system protein FeoA
LGKQLPAGVECTKAGECVPSLPPCPAATFASAAVTAAAVCREPCGDRVCSMLGCQGGDSVRVHSVDSGLSCCGRLAELGIIEGAELLVLKQSEPMLVLTRDSRIAIDRQTAARIEVSYASAS